MTETIKKSLTQAIWKLAEDNDVRLNVTDYDLIFEADGRTYFALIDAYVEGTTDYEEDTGVWWWEEITASIHITSLEDEDEQAVDINLTELGRYISRELAL